MTELAYMVREDWAQRGTAMVPQSAVIRAWLGPPPYIFTVTDVRKHNREGRSADVESANFIAPEAATREILDIGKLASLEREDKVIDHAISVLHPHSQRDLDVIRKTAQTEAVTKVFVQIWSPGDVVRTWLDGFGALDLHANKAAARPDPLIVAACKMMVGEEYNGLSSGIGKAVVVQLIRAFAARGYPIEGDAWLRAYFAAGGSFRHAESVAKFAKEMKAGTRHRVQTRYRENIFEIIRDRLAVESSRLPAAMLRGAGRRDPLTYRKAQTTTAILDRGSHQSCQIARHCPTPTSDCIAPLPPTLGPSRRSRFDKPRSHTNKAGRKNLGSVLFRRSAGASTHVRCLVATSSTVP